MNKVSTEELLLRIKSLEKEMGEVKSAMSDIQTAVAEQDKYDVKLKGKIDALTIEVQSVKVDVISIVQQHNNKMWRLVMGLLIIIGLLAGIKIGPDLAKVFMG